MALKQGWGYPTLSSRKEHWFPEGEQRSGCGRYGRVLPVVIEETRPINVDKICTACARKADEAGGA